MRRLALLLVLFLLLPTHAPASEELELLGCIPGELGDFGMEHGYACCATGSGLLVLDLSVPGSPSPAGFLPLRDDSRGIALRNGLVYLTPEDADLLVVNVSDPCHPAVLGSAPLIDGGSDLILVDHYAYVSTPIDWLRVYDVSDPAAPAQVGFLHLPDEGVDMELQGDRLYIVGESGDLFAVDVGDPAHPELDEILAVPGLMRGLAVKGSYAYLAAASQGLKIVDVSGPQMLLVGEASLDYDIHWGTWSEDCVLDGDRLYMAIHEHGLGRVDVSDPKAPVEMDYIVLPGHARSIMLDGGRALLGCSFGGLVEVDLGDPAAPAQSGRYGLLGEVRDIRLRDGLAYLAAGYGPDEEKGPRSREYSSVGLYVLDLADPAWPEPLAFEPSSYKALEVCVDGDLGMIAGYLGGVCLYDLSDPLQPATWADILIQGASYWDVELRGELGFVVSDYYQLQIFDLGDPSAPIEIGQCPDFFSYDMVVDLPYIYGATRYGGLQIVDASDPADPVLVGHLDLDNGWCGGMHLEGRLLYVARGYAGLFVYDVSDPANPRELGNWDSPGLSNDVFVQGELAYLSEGDWMGEDGGLRLLDVSDPARIVELASAGHAELGLAVEKMEDRVYVADGFGGLYVYRAWTATGAETPAPTAALGFGYPNPFNPGTRIPYRLAEETAVSLGVYDAEGRLLRRLEEGIRGAGEHRAYWDGRDGRGRPLPSGVYLCRLEAAGFRQSTRLVLLK